VESNLVDMMADRMADRMVGNWVDSLVVDIHKQLVAYTSVAGMREGCSLVYTKARSLVVDKPVDCSLVDKPVGCSLVDKPGDCSLADMKARSLVVDKPVDCNLVDKPVDCSLVDKPVVGSWVDSWDSLQGMLDSNTLLHICPPPSRK
jgi:hypothetical protein